MLTKATKQRAIKTRASRQVLSSDRFAQLLAEHSVPSRPPEKMALYARPVMVEGATQRSVAERFGVTQQSIAQAVRYFRELDQQVR